MLANLKKCLHFENCWSPPARLYSTDFVLLQYLDRKTPTVRPFLVIIYCAAYESPQRVGSRGVSKFVYAGGPGFDA